MRRVFGIFAAATLAVATGAPAAAQFALGSGAIVARVRDAAGRPLPGALVAVDGPTARQANTNAGGLATFAALPPGRYGVSVALAGYGAWSGTVSVSPVVTTPQVVAPQLQAASFANLSSAASIAPLPALRGGIDPFVAHALSDEAETNVVAGERAPAISLDGTLPGESRVEIDGIPLAGGAESPAIVRFRDLFGLAAVDLDPGPASGTSSFRDAVGGVVNYRTPAPGDAAVLGVDTGHDSALGDFAHARATQSFGPLAFAFDGVTGGAADRSSSLRASYAFAPGSSADFALYDLSSTGAIGFANAASVDAPAFSAGLRLAAGGGTLEARAFRSTLSVTGDGAADESARVNGLQLGYDLPLGENRLDLSFDRRSQSDAGANAAEIAQTFTTFVARGNVELARAVRLELADGYSGGTLVPARNDPQVAVALRPTNALSIRLAAGSAFATAPDDVLAARTATSPALAPETAFGYRLTANDRIDASSRVWLTAYDERRFDLFAPSVDGANRGIGLGVERSPMRGFGALAYVAFARSSLAGGAQAAVDQIPGDPVSKARVALTYRSSATCEDRFGATLLGAGNALSARSATFAAASLCASAFHAVDVHVGIENLFGVRASSRVLAPLYVPREFTLSIGTGALRGFGAP